MNMFLTLNKDQIIKDLNKDKFIQLCENVMNSSSIYDRRMFKEEFKKIYNDPKHHFNFPLNNSLLSNIISNWKKNSYKFTKASVLYNKYDYELRLNTTNKL